MRFFPNLIGPTLLLLAMTAVCRAQDEGPLPALQKQQTTSEAPLDSNEQVFYPPVMQRRGVAAQHLDNDAIIRMTKADLGEALIVQMIRTQPANYQTGPDDLIALKNAGVSQAVISAMLARNSNLFVRRLPRQPEATARALEVTPLSPDVDDPGLYFKNSQGQWEPASPELIKYRDGGALKSVLTRDIIKKDLNGEVTGPRSPLQIEPGTEMMLLAPRPVDAVEYIILRFRQKSDRREFRVRTGNVFHSETGADRDALEIPIHKITSRVFSFTVPADITKGEYGVLPPGFGGGMTYAGKMYTFRISK